MRAVRLEIQSTKVGSNQTSVNAMNKKGDSIETSLNESVFVTLDFLDFPWFLMIISILTVWYNDIYYFQLEPYVRASLQQKTQAKEREPLSTEGNFLSRFFFLSCFAVLCRSASLSLSALTHTSAAHLTRVSIGECANRAATPSLHLSSPRTHSIDAGE